MMSWQLQYCVKAVNISSVHLMLEPAVPRIT